MSTENALPTAEVTATAGASETIVDDAVANESQAEGHEAEAKDSTEEKAKPEKTAEQREIERLRRGIDRKTRLLAEERARNMQPRAAEPANIAATDNDEPLKLTRAQIQELVNAEAAKLAPTLREQASEVERRTGVVKTLTKAWGQEKFDELASDLDDALGGLADRAGRPRPVTEAIFEADNPADVIEFLADPEHSEEAESISRMSAAQAGKAIAKLESRLAAESAKSKPKPSNVPAPLESIRSQGSNSSVPNPSDTKAYIRWANEQERKGL